MKKNTETNRPRDLSDDVLRQIQGGIMRNKHDTAKVADTPIPGNVISMQEMQMS